MVYLVLGLFSVLVAQGHPAKAGGSNSLGEGVCPGPVSVRVVAGRGRVCEKLSAQHFCRDSGKWIWFLNPVQL